MRNGADGDEARWKQRRRQAYRAWMADYAERAGYLRGKCTTATREMVAAFPELRRVRGFVSVVGFGVGGDDVEHAWCESDDGEIFDPTVKQFPAVADYRAFEPGDVVRVGKCMQCGFEIYARMRRLAEPGDDAAAFERDLIAFEEGATSVMSCSAGCEEKLRADLGW